MAQNSVTGSGFIGGGYAGYNYQIKQFVIGIDGDYSWASLTGSNSTISPTGFTDRQNDKVKWLATVTGRLGYAVDNWLFFGKGGWAWAGFSGTSAEFNVAGVNTANGTYSTTRDGWTLGTGVEWGFARNWSAKVEYDYVKFSTANYNESDTNTGVGGGSPAGTVNVFGRSATSYLNIFKLGVAYRF
jgi:outer membrane immunogenic protein